MDEIKHISPEESAGLDRSLLTLPDLREQDLASSRI